MFAITIATRPLHPDFGIELRHCDEAVEQLVPRVVAALASTSVVLLRDLALPLRRHLALASMLGAIVGESNAAGGSRRPGVRIERGAGSFTEYWHADQSWADRPDVISVLACIDAESNADPIQFADTAVAYERLDVELKAEIEDLGAFHHVEVSRQLRHGSELVSGQRTFRTRLRQRVFGEARRALLPSAARVITPYSTHPPGVVHPIVTTSPVSGRCAIRLGDHAWRTTGDDEARAVGLIDSLNERLVDSNNVWTHHWRSGDLILYDNSSVLHRRLVAGGPASGRTLRRVMVQLDEQLVVSISQGSGHGLRVDDSIGQGASDEQVDCGGRSAV